MLRLATIATGVCMAFANGVFFASMDLVARETSFAISFVAIGIFASLSLVLGILSYLKGTHDYFLDSSPEVDATEEQWEE